MASLVTKLYQGDIASYDELFDQYLDVQFLYSPMEIKLKICSLKIQFMKVDIKGSRSSTDSLQTRFGFTEFK